VEPDAGGPLHRLRRAVPGVFEAAPGRGVHGVSLCGSGTRGERAACAPARRRAPSTPASVTRWPARSTRCSRRRVNLPRDRARRAHRAPRRLRLLGPIAATAYGLLRAWGIPGRVVRPGHFLPTREPPCRVWTPGARRWVTCRSTGSSARSRRAAERASTTGPRAEHPSRCSCRSSSACRRGGLGAARGGRVRGAGGGVPAHRGRPADGPRRREHRSQPLPRPATAARLDVGPRRRRRTEPDAISTEDACGSYALRGIVELARRADLSIRLLDSHVGNTAGEPGAWWATGVRGLVAAAGRPEPVHESSCRAPRRSCGCPSGRCRSNRRRVVRRPLATPRVAARAAGPGAAGPPHLADGVPEAPGSGTPRRLVVTLRRSHEASTCSGDVQFTPTATTFMDAAAVSTASSKGCVADLRGVAAAERHPRRNLGRVLERSHERASFAIEGSSRGEQVGLGRRQRPDPRTWKSTSHPRPCRTRR